MRLLTLQNLGLGYLTLERGTPTLSSGELQRLRLATQIRSNLFGVVYVLDEPTAGLHPSDGDALVSALQCLKEGGNSLFIVEHDIDVMRRADWIVDVGPAAGTLGGQVLYSGLPAGLEAIKESQTARYLFALVVPRGKQRQARAWLHLSGLQCNNLHALDAKIPLGVLTAVTGVSGSGKSSLVSVALVELISDALSQEGASVPASSDENDLLEAKMPGLTAGCIEGGLQGIRRLVQGNQKPIASCSLQRLLRGPEITMPAASRLTSVRADAPLAKARDSSASSCYSCPASMRRAPTVMAAATTTLR